MPTLRLGTRGSALALVQSHHVRDRLRMLFPELTVDLVVIKTTGDRLSETGTAMPAGKGVFIKEIEEALRDKRVDLAVHSLKDVPTELPPGFELAAILEREDPRDCLISRFGEQLLELPRGSILGTSSPRRQAQIRAAKKTLRLVDMRGNLDTRLRKVAQGDVDAAVVAYAGVRRLGRAGEVSEIISLETILPAPGQGFVAVETREGDADTQRWVSALDHPAGRRAADAARAFLTALGGGCRVPIAAHAREVNGVLTLEGLVISLDGQQQCRARHAGPPAEAAQLGAELGARLLQEGAGEIRGSGLPPK
jgi:hydroxymethylbilane synthase